jgi:hypothetical protein
MAVPELNRLLINYVVADIDSAQAQASQQLVLRRLPAG